jgi:SAM-dependent methyltransferase
MTGASYPGRELELFAAAAHWKRYLAAEIAPFLGRRVLEVGAGIGATTLALARDPSATWLCLEPDPRLAATLGERIARGELPPFCAAMCGALADLPGPAQYDTILYVDVLEHIEDDVAEMRTAALRLAPGGHLVVLSPAHAWLYSPFDEAVGHHRRYTRRTLAAVGPKGVDLVRMRYIDSVGLLASLANRVALKQAIPTLGQVMTWDRMLVPLSTWIDPILGHRLGKSVIAVWRRRA